jgi:hypothetical protein
MPLEPVHVLELDRATSKMELVRINPTRTFLEATPSGMASYTWQNGQWFGQGGQPMAEAEVPQAFRDELAAHPIVVETRGPAVTATCQFCGETMNRSALEVHLIAHVRDTLGKAGSTAPEAETIPSAARRTPRPAPPAPGT